MQIYFLQILNFLNLKENTVTVICDFFCFCFYRVMHFGAKRGIAGKWQSCLSVTFVSLD